mmetsp:Transcript_23793/g.33268  ORF Transcript_23793/g.33268 Transcript_23793/m.33268 type:complete len:344 (+) Transcript_23793:196-1227(+)
MASLPAIRRQGLRMTSLSLSTLASSSSASSFTTSSTLENVCVQRHQKQQQRNLMTTTPTDAFTSCQHHDNYAKNQIRWFGRKAAKMGRHRETLEELAHSKEHDEAVERRKANKKRKQGGGIAATEKDDDELVPPMEEDASETQFGGDLGEDEEDDIPELPDPSDVKQRMVRVVDRLVESFKAVRGAEPTPELFDPIMVEAYGDKVNLSAVAQVVIVSPTLATVSCFDPSLAKDVKTAIQVQLELNPQLEEDGMVKVPLPRASAESRAKTVKLLGKQAEIGRSRIRNIRRAAMDIVKKGKDGKLDGISKDDAFRTSKDIDAVTEEVVGMLNEQVEFKQESVMAV